MTNSDRFIGLRDQLLRAPADWEGARAEFRWPRFGEFNWVGDYFDVIAAGNGATALRMVDDAGADQSVSFAAMSARAAQVAAFLASQGVKRGDRLLLMLPNCTALWEVMLAAIRLGAVIIPATTLAHRALRRLAGSAGADCHRCARARLDAVRALARAACQRAAGGHRCR